MPDIYFWRQCLFLITGLLYSLTCGFALAYPSVLNQAIISMNTTDIIHTSMNHATWIAAANGFGGILGAFILSPIMDIYGRKAVQCSINFFIGVGWIILPFAQDIIPLYLGRFIQGISVCNPYIMGIIIGEYVHPTRRGYFITFKKVSICLGVMLCHAMSAFWTWRQIAIFAAVPPAIAVILMTLLPESPSHLAMIGKFEECKKSFVWMRGNSTKCEKELKTLIATHRKVDNRYNLVNKYKLRELLRTVLNKDFQKQIMISITLTLVLELCGRYFIVAYAIQIMQCLVSNQTSALHFTLGADIFILIALSFSTSVVKNFKRRTVLFTSGVVAVLIMFLISTTVFAHSFYNLSNTFLWSIAFVLITQCFVVNLGLIPVSFAIISEIFNLEHKGLAICVSDLAFTLLNALFLKVIPIMMQTIGLHSVYGIFGLILALCLLILYKIVPETKDKTLQEIQDDLVGLPNKDVPERVCLHVVN